MIDVALLSRNSVAEASSTVSTLLLAKAGDHIGDRTLIVPRLQLFRREKVQQCTSGIRAVRSLQGDEK